MSTSAGCLLCGVRDSWKHALINCTMAHCIWALSDEGLVEQMCQYISDNARDCLFTMNNVLSHDLFVRMVVTLWAIWGARRKAVYEDIHQTPLSTHLFIQSYMNDLQVLSKPRVLTAQTNLARPTQWQPPPENLAKVNVDAATIRNSGVGTVAAVCRDREGLFLGASTIFFRGIYDPTTLEALAVREAMALAEDLNLQAIHVSSDCKVVIDDIQQKSGAIYGAIIHEIIEYSSSFNSCNFVHEFRSSNFEAHNLAKHALNLGVGRHVWLGNPGDFSFVPVNIVTDQ